MDNACALVSVRFSGVDDSPAQLEMFARTDEKRRTLAVVLDRLNAGGKLARVQHGHQLGGPKHADAAASLRSGGA